MVTKIQIYFNVNYPKLNFRGAKKKGFFCGVDFLFLQRGEGTKSGLNNGNSCYLWDKKNNRFFSNFFIWKKQ